MWPYSQLRHLGERHVFIQARALVHAHAPRVRSRARESAYEA
jgi:hypothetical protein